MKKSMIPLLVLGLAIGGYYWLKDDKPEADSTATTVGAGYHPNPSAATFAFDGEAVTLSNGVGRSVDSAIGLVTETRLLEERGYGDLNADKKEDAAVLLTQSGGGSGTFVYVAAFVSGPVGYKGTNAVFLGDRIEPTSVSVADGVATVKYLDRKPDEPMSAEPTVPTTKHFVYTNGEFVEKNSCFNDFLPALVAV
jgi:hypothetical protein